LTSEVYRHELKAGARAGRSENPSPDVEEDVDDLLPKAFGMFPTHIWPKTNNVPQMRASDNNKLLSVVIVPSAKF
jgi:hypothetical protein